MDVIATLTGCSEPILGETTYTFTDNGSYVFNFTDLLGNPGSTNASVSWIDKGEFTITMTYEPQNPHSGNITVIATLNSTGGVAPSGWIASGDRQYTRIFS